MSDREAPADAVTPGATGSVARTRPRALLVAGITAGVLLLVVLAAVAWIAVRAFEAKDSLESAEDRIGELRATLTEDPSAAPRIAAAARADTAHAVELTSDWVWRAAEGVPVAGRNLTVARELAVVVDRVAAEALVPLADIAGSLDPASLKPVDGRIDLAPLVAAAGPVAHADDVLRAARADVLGLETDGTLGPLSSAADRLGGLLGEAAELTGTARPIVDLLPGMLGADGPREYLLVFQNNAEVRSLGGNAASLMLATVDDGAVSITRQASSQDFPRDVDPPIALDPNLYAVYYAKFPRYVQDIATRPDFPTMAMLAQGWWEREFGQHVESVISFDPVALASLLKATGPVALPTGETLTADNAVELLLSEVYVRYPDPDASDAFFAAAAATIFDTLTRGDVDPRELFDALGAAVEERRLLAWSERPAEQKLLDTLPLSGRLPATNDPVTAVGVYFNDQSESKIDYWVDASVDATSTQCEAPEQPVFSVTFTLGSRLTPEQAETLPSYVVSSWGGPQLFRTDAYVLGPVGATLLDTTVVQPGLTNEVLAAGTDLGRPIVRLATNLAPGTSTTVTVRFAGAPGEYGSLAVATTPMVRETPVTVPAPCAD